MARVVSKPRQFKLINGQGNTWDLMSKQSLFINPQGLGYDLNTEYLRVGSVYELIDSYANQKIVSGEMVFVSYAVYKQFTEFVNVTPLKLAYMPLDEWAYMDVLTTSIEKTEFQFESTRLICPIQFTGSSKWYIPRKAERTSPAVENPKKYTYKYKSETIQVPTTETDNPIVIQFAEAGTPSAMSVNIEPIQSGSGTPSPDNVRPISGMSEVTITREGIESADTETVTIQLGQTVYGGTLDVLTGVLTVDKVYLSYTSATLYGNYGDDNAPLYYVNIPSGVIIKGYWWNQHTDGRNIISNYFSKISTGAVERMRDGEFRTQAGENITRFYFRWDSADLTQINTSFASVPWEIVADLVTPTTVQLTPEQVELLEGYNVLTTDADSLTMTYTENVPTGDGYYTYADDLNGVIRINNNSSEDSPCIITIFGQIENPSWYLTVNNKQIASGAVTAIIPEGHKLVINSNDGELEVSEYISQTDEFVRNLYQNIDFDRETFINVPKGNSVITITGVADTISAMVEVKELHETI